MRNHTKVYFEALGYDLEDFIPCEITGLRAVDIHHIENRSIGGNPYMDKDRIENLMAVTREVHLKYGDNLQFMAELFQRHKYFLEENLVDFDEDYINQKIVYYESITMN